MRAHRPLASLESGAVRSRNRRKPRAHLADARLGYSTIGIGHLNITACDLLNYVARFPALRLLLMRFMPSFILGHLLHDVIGDGARPARTPRLRALGTMPNIRI